MLTLAVESYIAMRRTCGFKFEQGSQLLREFAAFSEARGHHYVISDVAIEWARHGATQYSRARRLAAVCRFARYIRAEDQRHEVPTKFFGPLQRPRPTPYIFTSEQIQCLMKGASEIGRHPLRRYTYRTFFGLLACTGLRVSEAIRLRYSDITADGLIIRHAKFGKSRLVPIQPTVREALMRYIEQRRAYERSDDHVFVSLAGTPLLFINVYEVFKLLIRRMGLPSELDRPRPTIHSLRHTFAVRALEACPDGRDRIAKHMLALSTYLGHSRVEYTYWYLEATPQLMRDISTRAEQLFTGGRQ